MLGMSVTDHITKYAVSQDDDVQALSGISRGSCVVLTSSPCNSSVKLDGGGFRATVGSVRIPAVGSRSSFGAPVFCFCE
jgi:hypothetical protein